MYQSEIHVELIEDCSDKLVRIYEMIHRNNQLNFTKDRISQEEVDRIFTDPEITSGVVHVTDKYGDHGIIGCYAIKDGKALQLVFSCRILGMGVEQWVYAELGYPDIEVVGEVATQLNKTDKPKWINNTTSVQKETVLSSDKTPKLIVYGSCPLRPVWSYLQPKLPNAKFAEIDPGPCPLNLAIAKRASDECIKNWMSKVDTINNIYTFDKEIYSSYVSFILITLYGVEYQKKYQSKCNSTYFYSAPISKQNMDSSIADEYVASKITVEDIEKELSFICENLPQNATLLIQTLPEVEFPQKGKDADYYSRIEQNIVAEKITKKYQNAQLIDIRKYAKSPTDFFEPVSNHYNRSIGFYLANDIFKIMGIENHVPLNVNVEDSTKNDLKKVPDNAIKQSFEIPDSSEKCEVISYVFNGVFTVNITLDNPEKYLIQYFLLQNRHIRLISDITDELTFSSNIFAGGLWRSTIRLLKKNTKEKICEFLTRWIDLSSAKYFNHIDSTLDSYNKAVLAEKNYAQKSVNYDSTYAEYVNQTATLSSLGGNPFDFFVKNGIDEISIVLDEKIGNLIIPFLNQSKIKVRYMYTIDKVWWIKSTNVNYQIRDISDNLFLSNKDTVLFALVDFVEIKNIFCATHAKLVSYAYILSNLLTEKLFVDRIAKKAVKTIAVRSANLYRYHAYNYAQLTTNEKMLEDKQFINEADVLNRLNNNYDSIAPHLKKIELKKLLETFQVPQSYIDSQSRIQRYVDKHGDYVNIINGIRRTIGNPESYIGTVYIFGGPHTFGYGVDDSETIASYLQSIIGLPFRIVNCANCWNEDYTPAINLIENTEFKNNDIAVFIMSNWQDVFFEYTYRHWLRWEAIEDPIIKVDAFPLFEKRDRPDYFLHRYGYTPECNLELAKLIRDAIYKNIKLFDIE